MEAEAGGVVEVGVLSQQVAEAEGDGELGGGQVGGVPSCYCLDARVAHRPVRWHLNNASAGEVEGPEALVGELDVIGGGGAARQVAFDFLQDVPGEDEHGSLVVKRP